MTQPTLHLKFAPFPTLFWSICSVFWWRNLCGCRSPGPPCQLSATAVETSTTPQDPLTKVQRAVSKYISQPRPECSGRNTGITTRSWIRINSMTEIRVISRACVNSPHVSWQCCGTEHTKNQTWLADSMSMSLTVGKKAEDTLELAPN